MTALTVHNAEILTATVEVKTLTLSGRQVTQAVFRQLPERALITDDGTLAGKPWGRVNYHPDKCSGSDRHLHVVWQQDHELFRARVDLDVEYPRWFDTETASGWVDAKVRADAVNLPSGWTPLKDEFLETVLGLRVRMFMSRSAQSVSLLLERYESVRQAIAEHGPFHRVTGFGAAVSARSGMSGRAAAMAAARAASLAVPAAEAAADLHRRITEATALLPGVALDEAERQLTAAVQAEIDRRNRHSGARRAAAELPQLFIAAG